MSISKTRSMLYKAAKILGDVQAVSSGSGKKMIKRAGRKIVGRHSGRFIRKLFK